MLPGFTDALVALGKAWTAQGDLPRAVGHLLEAVKASPDNDVAHYRLAQAYRQMGKPEEAGKEMEEFRRLRSAMQSVRALYKQVQGARITAQTADKEP